MVEIINYVSSKGGTMKFVPRVNSIECDFYVLEKGVEFREIMKCSGAVLDTELNNYIWNSINRLEENIKIKFAQ